MAQLTPGASPLSALKKSPLQPGMDNTPKPVDLGRGDAAEFDPTPEMDLRPAPVAEIEPTADMQLVPAPVSTAEEISPEGMDLRPAPLPGDEDESAIQQVLSGVQTGFKETVLPWFVSPEEAKKGAQPKSAKETLAQMASGMGFDIAAGAAATQAGAYAGALTPIPGGTALGALAGMLGYAIYTSAGQEKLAEARGGEFNPARMALRTAAAINPLARTGGRFAKSLLDLGTAGKAAHALVQAGEKVGARAARVAGQAAAEATIAGSEHGADSVPLTLLASVGLHGLAFRSAARVTPEISQAIGNFADSSEGRDSVVRAANRMRELPQESLQYTEDKLTPDFARYVLDKDPEQLIGLKDMEEAAAVLGKQREATEMYSDYVASKFLKEEVANTAQALRSQLSVTGKDADIDPLNKALARWSDGQSVAQDIDRAMGSGATQTLNSLSESRGKFENLSAILLKSANTAYKTQRKARISDNEMGYLRAYLSEGRPDYYKEKISKFLDPEGNVHGKVKDAVDAWSSAFDSSRSVLQTFGYKPEYVDTYMPISMLKNTEVLDALGEIRESLSAFAPKMPKDLKAWASEDLAKNFSMPKEQADNLLEQITRTDKLARWKNGLEPNEPLTMQDIGTLYKDHQSSSSTRRMGAKISAVMSRDDADRIPDEFREFNIRQAFSNYLNGSVKTAVMSGPMRAARSQEEAFKAAGLNDTALWWKNMYADLSGQGRDNLAKTMGEWGDQIDHTISKGMKNSNLLTAIPWAAAAGTRDLLKTWQQTVYPATMALNIRGHLRNMSANLALTAPMLGGPYGYEVVSRAAVNNPFKYIKHLKDNGLLAAGRTSEAMPQPGDATKTVVNRIGNIAMASYQVTDSASRIWAYAAGKEIAKDIAGGREAAMSALANVGPGLRLELRKRGFDSLDAIKSNVEEVGDIIGRHMISTTQFHYGAEQRSQVLRDLGPMFSMFTKWPVAVSSDIRQIWKRHPKLVDKVTRIGEKYLSPLALTYMVAGAMGDEKESPYLKWLVGNPVDWAPVMATADVSVLNNPVVETALGGYSLAAEMAKNGIDVSKLDKNSTAAVKKVLDGIATKTIPGVSSVLNELNRYNKSVHGEKLTKSILDEYLGD